MSTTRVFARLGVTVGAAVAALWVASPAFAADPVRTDISGLSSTFTAGAGRPDSFRADMQNNTDTELQPVRRVIVVRLAGVTPDNVRIYQGSMPLPLQSGGPDEVGAADLLQVRLAPNGKHGDSSNQTFGIQFTSSAPNGRGEVIFQAYRGQELLGSTARNVTIKGGLAQSTPSPTPSRPSPTASTDAVPAPADSQGSSTVAVAPIPGDKTASYTSTGSGIPVTFYVLGAILVAAGGAILWLLFRPRPAVVAGHPPAAYEPVRASPLGYPDPAPTLGYPQVAPPLPTPRSAQTANVQPTTIMPAVRGAAAPPPPVDPWAGGSSSADTTQAFEPPRHQRD
jgi:hypothetical protein